MSTGHVQQHDFAAQSPFQSKEENFVSEALQRQTDMQARMIRPWVGVEQIPLFRPKYGYETEALTVTQVLSMDRSTLFNTNYTGGAWDINGSARNTGPGWV